MASFAFALAVGTLIVIGGVLLATTIRVTWINRTQFNPALRRWRKAKSRGDKSGMDRAMADEVAAHCRCIRASFFWLLFRLNTCKCQFCIDRVR